MEKQSVNNDPKPIAVSDHRLRKDAMLQALTAACHSLGYADDTSKELVTLVIPIDPVIPSASNNLIRDNEANPSFQDIPGPACDDRNACTDTDATATCALPSSEGLTVRSEEEDLACRLFIALSKCNAMYEANSCLTTYFSAYRPLR